MNINMNLLNIRRHLKENYWSTRLLSEIDFLNKVMQIELKGDSRILEIIEKIEFYIIKEGNITKSLVEDIELELKEYEKLCKNYSLHCVGHAHIDMNWQWGFHETVMITIETFKTVLKLFEYYPDFKFSQSQASVYQIIEKYAPYLIAPIKQKIIEGRWEVTASQWVECDMNLPSAESLVRQLSYAKQYLKDLFCVNESAFKQVFLPDTFGHGIFSPELFASAGVNRLYHCRGSNDHNIYRWLAPSGRSILVYHEVRWYNTEIDASIAQFLPEYYEKTGCKTAFCLYGVGDHGGGPTMKDIERLIDMSTWPIFPRIKFSTIQEGFNEIENRLINIPEIVGERNPIFNGCYSSQSRIKMANRKSQELLYETEYLEVISYLKKGNYIFNNYFRKNIRDAWVRVLFNQFHDILPGSGVQLTREHALGSFQEIAAAGLSASSYYLKELAHITDSVNNKKYLNQNIASKNSIFRKSNTYHGAGVGFGVEEFKLPAVERSIGEERYYKIFNLLQWDRYEKCEIILWNWIDSPDTIHCFDENNNEVNIQVLDESHDPYSGQRYIRLVLLLYISAFGCKTLNIKTLDNTKKRFSNFYPHGINNNLITQNDNLVLENDVIKVIFNSENITITSFIRKSDGLDIIPYTNSKRSEAYAGVFRLIIEDSHRMTAWISGRHKKEVPLTNNIRLIETHINKNDISQWIEYEVPISEITGSKAKVKVYLDRDSDCISYSVTCDWLEIGNDIIGVPKLDFYMLLRDPGSRIRTDVPFGIIDRECFDMDVVGLTFGARQCRNESAVVSIMTDTKQAYRMDKDGLSVILLRSSYDPDPYPELGRHSWKFSISILPSEIWDNTELLYKKSLSFIHPYIVQSLPEKPVLHAKYESYIKIEGEGVIITTIKRPDLKSWINFDTNEDRVLIIRLFEIQGRDKVIKIYLPGEIIKSCKLLDIHENPIEQHNDYSEDGIAIIPILHYGIHTIQIILK